VCHVTRTGALAALWSDARVVEHAGAHCIPSGAVVRDPVRTFVEEVLRDVDEEAAGDSEG
jgi:hypothetical protein